MSERPSPADLASTAVIDSEHPAIRRRVAELLWPLPPGDEVAAAVLLFYAVRDGICYNPYRFSLDPDRVKASATLAQGDGYCVPKAILLAAFCRAAGIPARIGIANVRNHSARIIHASSNLSAFGPQAALRALDNPLRG